MYPSVPSSANSSSSSTLAVGASVQEFLRLAVDTSAVALADSQGHTTITPDPNNGTQITGDINVAVTTNTSNGYNLTVLTQDNTKNMTHSLPTVDTAINSIDSISGYDASTGASSLSNNTWGFRKNTGTVQEPVYTNWYAVGAKDSTGTVIDSPGEGTGSYCDSLSYPLNQSGCNPSSYRTYNINVGAKLTSSLPAGTYTNDIVFSATTKAEGTKYTMNFNSNGGNAGNVINPRIVVAGLSVNLPTSGFTKDGYRIKGWAFTDGATTPVYTAGQTVATNDLILAARAAGQDTETNNSFTVYAVWEEIVYMQNFACNTSLPNIGDSMTVRDSRDNTDYVVKKLQDGKCWMIENLTISATNMVVDSLDNTNTNIPSSDSGSYYLPPRNASYEVASSIQNSAVKGASAAVNFSYSGDYSRYPQVGYRAASTTDNSTGNPVPEDTAYYNFYTATLGFSYYNDGKSAGTSPRDICPKGWRLPRISTTYTETSGTRDFTGDFAVLANTYNPDATWNPTDLTANRYTSDATIRKNMISGDSGSEDRFANNGAAGFTYAGYYDSTTLNSVGTNGNYWSSSVYGTNDSYYLYFDTTSVYPQGRSNKYYGFAVRCVAKDITDLTYMQDITPEIAANTSVGTSATLKDSRDNTEYTVKKLSDGKVWMTDNLILGHDKGYALTNADTNIQSTDTATYYLPQAGYTGALNSASTTGSATFDDSTRLNQAHVQYRAQGSSGDIPSSGTLGQSTGYYNFYAATLGCSHYNDGLSSGQCASGYIQKDICPKGWHLPTGGASGQFVALDIAMNGGTGSSRTDTTARDRFLNDASFLYSGYYYNSQLFSVGSYGYWWSSTVSNTNSGYSLYLNSNGYVNPRNSNYKYSGYAVRCMAN